MRFLQKCMDPHGHVQGKFIAIITTVALVFTMCNIAVFAAIGNNNDQAQEVATQAGEDTNDKSQVKQEAPDEAVVHVDAGNGYITYGGGTLDGKSGSFKAKYAEPLTLNASANEGYKLESVTVTGGGQFMTFNGESFTIPADMVTNDLKVTLSTVKDESESKDSAGTPIDGDKSDKADKSNQNKNDKASEKKTDTEADIPKGTEGKTDENSGKTDEGKPEAPKVDENNSASAPEGSGEGSGVDQNTENNGATEGEGNGGILGVIKDGIDGIKDGIDRIIGGDENAEEADVGAAAAKTYTVEVEESITIYGSSSWWHSDHEWSCENAGVAKVDDVGSPSVSVTGVSAGDTTVTHTWKYRGRKHSETFAVKVTPASPKDAAIFFLKDPTANPNSNTTEQWFPTNGYQDPNLKCEINVAGAQWVDDGKNTYDVTHRVVSWPDGKTGTTWELPRDNEYWGQVFEAYKGTVWQGLGIYLTVDDVEAIILEPYKISKNTSGYHLDCTVKVKAKNVVMAEFKLWDVGGSDFVQVGEKKVYKTIDGVAAVEYKAGDMAPTKIDGNGNEYVFKGWYTNKELTEGPVKFPYSAKENVTFYAKYVPKPLGIVVGALPDVTYDGSDQAQEPVVNDEKGRPLTKGTDYELTYSNDVKNACTVTVTVKPKGNYTGEADVQYKILPREVKLTSATDTKVYDGTALTNSRVDVSGDNFVAGEGVTASVTGAQTNAGTSDNTFTYTLNEGTKAENYIITEEKGKLSVTPQSITLTSASDEKVYDGTALTNGKVDVTGSFANGEGFTDNVTGTQTNAGTSDNTFTYTLNEGTKAENYTITKVEGKLKVTPITDAVTVTITENSANFTYDGNEHNVTGYTTQISNNLYKESDFAFSGNNEVKGTDAGFYDMHLASSDFMNISGNFTNVKFEIVDGKLSIKPREVTLTSKSDSKPYDGTALTRPEVTVSDPGFVAGEVDKVEATGSVTDVSEGEVINTIVVTSGTNFKESNYSIEKNEGKLSIQSTDLDVNSVKWAKEDVDKKYDGHAHPAGTATAEDKYGNALVVEYSADGVNWTKSSTDIAARNVADSKTVKLRATSPNYNGGQYATHSEELSITKRELAITSASDNKTFDGTPLTKYEAAVSGDGFAGDEGAEYSFTGTQTDVGTSDNTFTYTLTGGAIEGNYDITPVCGKLTVTADETTEVVVTIEGETKTATYDGKSHSVMDYKVISISNVNYKTTDFSLKDGVEAKASRTDVGTTYMKLTADSFENKSSNFKKVKFHVTDGYITINPKQLAANEMVVEKPADVVYNGQPQQQKPVVKDGNKTLKEDEDYTLTFSDAINAGEVTVTVHGQGNYDGTKTVTYEILKRDVKLVSETASKPYDGTPLTKPEVDGWQQNDADNTGFVTGEVTGVEATGSVIDVSQGEVTNSIVYNEGERFNADNYNIEKVEGKLSIKAVSVEKSMVVDSPDDFTYDGNEHKWAPTVTDKNGNPLTEGTDYTVFYNKDDFTNVTGYIGVTITGIDNYFGNIERSYQITPALLKVTTGSAEKPFDGTPLTNGEISVKGFVNGEVPSYAATGSRTEVGESSNTYAIVWTDTVKSTNYRVEAALGTLKVTPANPMLTVTKKVVSESDTPHRYEVGETVRFEVTVTNNGNVTVSGIQITDKLPNAVLENEIPQNLTLTPGEHFEAYYNYVVEQTDVANGKGIINTAEATGTASGGTPVNSELGKATASTVAPKALLKVTKETISKPANPNGYVQGETIRYEVTVKNSGNMSMSNTAILDELDGVVPERGEISGIWLDPGQSASATFTYTVTAQDVANGKVTNTATATGNPVGGKLEVISGTTEDPTYNPPVPTPTPTYENPSMVITKTASITSGAKAGDIITYNVTVRNNGDCDLTNVNIVDPLTGDKWNIDKLAVNATQSFTTQPYTVTTDDMKAGQVVNTATGTTDNPTGKPTKVTPGSATTYIDKINASWTIDKSVTSTPANGSFYKKGEAISYKIVVTNTGNVDLTDIELKDSLVNLGAQGSIDKLAPGESRTITYDYTVTAADVSKGKVVNSVTGTATGPDPVKPGGDKDDVNTGEDNPKPTPTPGPSGDNTNPVAPGGGNGGNGGNVVTPTTPVAPVTPGMTETPSGETSLDANETPLAPANADVHCWVHWWIIVFMLLTLVYGCAVLIRRNGNSRELQEQQDRLLRKDDEQAQR